MFSAIKCKIKEKRFWKKGSGELVGFVCLMPFIIILICAVIASVQVAITNQNLNYCAYNAGRSAVVSDSFTIAKARANEVYDNEMGTSNKLTYGYESCTLEIISGTEWQKGAYVRCTVRYYIDTLMPFTSGIREQTIVMMVENGDSDQ